MRKNVLIASLISLLSLSAWGARPVISHVQSTATNTSCTVTWTTDVGSDSLLALGTGAGPHIPAWTEMEAATTDKTGSGVTTHAATIDKGLFPGVAYNIYLRSRPVSRGVVHTKPGDAGWYDGTSNCNNMHDGSVCNCGGRTLPATAAGGPSYDFQFQLQGAASVVQGYDVYVQIYYADVARPDGYVSSLMDVSIAGLPPNSVVEMYDAGNGFVSSWDSGTGLLKLHPSTVQLDTALHIITTDQTPAGAYTITLNAHAEKYPDVAHTYSYRLNVVPPPVFPSGTPSAYPKIPGIGDPNEKGTWLYGMVTKGLVPGACGANRGASANFYDGIRAYLQAKSYDIAHRITRHPEQWDKCIENRKLGYVGYIDSTKPPGAIWAIYLASKGMAMLAQNGDTVARAALFDTADHAQWRTLRSSIMDVGYERELNFTTEAFIAAQAAGHPTAGKSVPIGITMMLGQVDQIVNAGVSHAPFLDGTLADTLIHYYIDSGSKDARIPAAIKSLADHLWVNYWIRGGCSGGTQQITDCFAYTAGQFHMGTDYSTNGYSNNDANLNLIIAPMYAWLFKMTGNGTIPGSDGSQCGGKRGQPCTYQQAGDTIFQSGVSQSDYFSPVKDWDQNFRWSFDYVTWRSR